MSERRSQEPPDGGPTASEETRWLFERAGTDRSARDALVARHRPLAASLARRYLGFGEPLDDFVQVASIGLLKAINRFDHSRGVSFVAFATPTIVGELKRHFRDRGWAVRVPRRLQEHALQVRRTMGELSQELGRSPTVEEIATATGMSSDDVLEASDAMLAYVTTSLDAPLAENMTLGETLPANEDHDLEAAEAWADLAVHIDRLPDRERRILVLRFFRGLTQTEIAEEVGVSQMHVSRLLARALQTLRRTLVGTPDPAG